MSRMVATGKWSFSFTEDTGWGDYDDDYATPTEALEAAREAAPDYADEQLMEADEKEDFLKNGIVFIGQQYVFEPIVDADFNLKGLITIKDIEKAMQAGYSTASENVRQLGFGAGMGLPNMDKYSDEMKIDTELGVGTTVTMIIYTK